MGGFVGGMAETRAVVYVNVERIPYLTGKLRDFGRAPFKSKKVSNGLRKEEVKGRSKKPRDLENC